MGRDRHHGYAGLPALMVAGAFAVPLAGSMAESLGLPWDPRVALLLAGATAFLVAAERARRHAIRDDGDRVVAEAEQRPPTAAD